MKNRFRIGIVLAVVMLIFTMQINVLAKDVDQENSNVNSIILQSTDVEPPTFNSVEIDKKEAIIGDAVTITVDAADERDQLLEVHLNYRKPITQREEYIILSKNAEGKYVGKYQVTNETEAGLWKIYDISIADTSGNHTKLFNQNTYSPGNTDLSNCDFTVSGTGGADVTPPIFNNVEIDKKEAFIGDVVTITVDAADERDQLLEVHLNYRKPITQREEYIILRKNAEGKYVGKYQVTNETEAGLWKIYDISIADTSGNHTKLFNQNTYSPGNTDLSNCDFTVSGTGGADVTPPIFNNVEIDKKEALIGDVVTITVDAADERDQLLEVHLNYRKPITQREEYILLCKNAEGKYVGKYQVTNETEAGLWKIYDISIADTSGNYTKLFNQNTYSPGNTDLSSCDFTVSGTINPGTPTPIPNSNIDEKKAIEDIEKALDGAIVEVPVKNDEPVPTTILETLRGRDINVVFEFDDYCWSINGKSIDVLSESAKTYDLSVKTIDDPELGKLSNGEDILQIEINHNGELPFIGQLTYNIEPALNGKTVYRYYYDEKLEKLVYQDEVVVKDGRMTFNFEHASKYVITDTDQIKDASIECSYQTHVQDIGWQGFKSDGEISGTSGRSLRLEGIQIKVENHKQDVGVEYQTHVENIGWQDLKSDGDMSGTSGKSLRLEAIKINLTGSDADKYDIYYCVHAQNVGWMGWAKNGQSSGTEGFGYRLEGIRILIVPRGTAAPVSPDLPFLIN